METLRPMVADDCGREEKKKEEKERKGKGLDSGAVVGRLLHDADGEAVPDGADDPRGVV
jgi:hypothetical protein